MGMVRAVAPCGVEGGCLAVQRALGVLDCAMKSLLGLLKGDVGEGFVVYVDHQ